MKVDYSKYKCPYEHIEKACGHKLYGAEGYEACSIWCACGYRGPAFCFDPDELGLEIKKPEEKKPWWLVPWMVVKDKTPNSVGYQGVYVLDKDNIHNFAENWFEFLPFGGPFDMIPEWATHIHFYLTGQGDFRDSGYIIKETVQLDFPVWHNCPEDFKGKTFSLEGLK